MHRFLILVVMTATACGSAATTTTPTSRTGGPTTSTKTATATSPTARLPTVATTTSIEAAAAPATVAPTVEGSLAVAEAPTAIATGSERLWVGSASGIVALDSETGTVMALVSAAGTVAMTLDTNIATTSADPPRLAACSTTQTVEIGTVTGEISATYPWGCTGIAVGAGALWIVRDDQLVELAPQGDAVSKLDVDDGLGVAATNDAVWVIEGRSGRPQLRQLDPGSRDTIATYPLDGQPDAVIADDAGVWVSERAGDGTETLVGFGTPANPDLHRYPSGSGGTAMDFSGQFLWVANDEGGISVLDTNTGDLVASPVLVPAGPAASGVRLVAADGRIFVTGRQAGVVQRVRPGTFGDSTRWNEVPSSIRIETASGCPASIASAAPLVADAPFANADTAGLDGAVVPGRPDGAVICAYGDVAVTLSALGSTTYVGGALGRSAHLDADAASALADTANATVAPEYASTCTADMDGPQYIVVAFSIPGRSDVDIWYEDYAGCPLLSNGHRVISPLINGFGDELSRLLDIDLGPIATG